MFQMRVMNGHLDRLIDTINSFLYAIFFMAFLVGMFALITVSRAEIIMYDGGGVVRDYIERAKTEEKIEIRGECYSSCTLLLRAKHVCIAKTATLHFHMPRVPDGKGGHRVAWEFEDWTMRQYPEPIRDMIKHYGGLQEDWTTLPGEIVIHYAGVDDCDEKPFESDKLWFLR
jgi:hypothetical protein